MDDAFFRDLSRVARTAIAAALGAGLIVDDKGGEGDGKDEGGARFDPVTQADRAAEQALRAAIEARFPDDAIWGEEYGWNRAGDPQTGGARRIWSLDPVDGTRALMCGLASWAVLVGVVEDDVHVAGMIDLPAIDQRLIALGGTTRRGDTPVRASGCRSLAEARLSTTDPYLFSGDEADGFARVRRTVRVTRYGLDAMAYARVATGDLDLVIESGLKRHDYDALVAVVRGAGGIIGDWQGGDLTGSGELPRGRVMAASTRSLYDEAVALLGGA